MRSGRGIKVKYINFFIQQQSIRKKKYKESRYIEYDERKIKKSISRLSNFILLADFCPNYENNECNGPMDEEEKRIIEGRIEWNYGKYHRRIKFI